MYETRKKPLIPDQKVSNANSWHWLGAGLRVRMSGSGKQHSWKEGLRGCPQGICKTSELGTAAKGRQDKTMDLRGDQGEEGLKEFSRWVGSSHAPYSQTSALAGLEIGPSLKLCWNGC